MKLSLEINLDNAAYHDDLTEELKNAFRTIINKIVIDDDNGVIFDSNGNKIGTWAISEDSYE